MLLTRGSPDVSRARLLMASLIGEPMPSLSIHRPLVLLALVGTLAAGCAGPQKITLRGQLVPLPEDQQPATIEEVEETLRANFARIHFPFDSAELTPESRKLLQENAALLEAHPSVQVTIEGHTDEAGSDVYNLALGDRRAMAVWNYLVTWGVPEEQLSRVSRGEYNPVVEAGERPEQSNRRAEFIVTSGDEVEGSAGG